MAQRRTEVRQLAQKAYKRRVDPHDPVHWEYKMIRNSYAVMIENAKKAHWVDFLQDIYKRTVWTVHRYASGEPSDGGQAQIPTLKIKEEDGMVKEVISSEDKSRIFEKTFFLEPECTVPSYEATTYPAPSFPFSPITDAQIK